MSKPATPREVTVRVIRPFYIGGQEIPADTVIKFQPSFAQEMLAANKVELSNESPRAPRDAKKPAAQAK